MSIAHKEKNGINMHYQLKAYRYNFLSKIKLIIKIIKPPEKGHYEL